MERVIEIPQADNVIHCRLEARVRQAQWSLKDAETALTNAQIDLMEHEVHVCERLGVAWPAKIDQSFLRITVIEAAGPK